MGSLVSERRRSSGRAGGRRFQPSNRELGRDNHEGISNVNVELARRAAEALSAGDLDGYFNYFDQDVVYHTRADEPDAGVYHGLDEWRSFFLASWLTMLEGLRADLEDLIDLGEQTISVVVMRGSGRSSGAKVAEPYVFLRTWREGKTVEVREFRTKEEALSAAGLEKA
jgi:ketosteroid isomerase-like protein